MNIKTLHVQNYKNFEDKTFEFTEGFNLFIGDNGTGKTAALEAIAAGISWYLDGIGFKNFSYLKPNDVRQVSFLKEKVFTLEPQYPSIVEASIEFILDSSNLLYSSRITQNSLVSSSGNGDLSQLGSLVAKRVHSGEDIIIPVICSYTAARTWFQGKGDINQSNSTINPDSLTPKSRLAPYSDVFHLNFSIKNWRDWLFHMELIKLQEGQEIKIYEAVKKAIQTCLDDCDLVYFDMRRNELVVRIQGKLMPFGLLSGGQSSMLAIVADIAYRMAQLNPHLLEKVTDETPGVVLIDELDLLLHPKWQRKVVDNLRKTFPKVQFIATSHSPFIIQSLRPGELIDLNEVEGAAEYQNKSIDDIAQHVMEIQEPQLSEAKQEQLRVAREYYEILEQAKDTDGVKLEQLKNRLDELSKLFSDNTAYHAFLEMKRLAAKLKESA
jgi:predicted ATP-binding protein involved in virulence